MLLGAELYVYMQIMLTKVLRHQDHNVYCIDIPS
ncbi:hypothetical protein ACHAWF_002239 [Thalassiosira exigua]